MSLKKCKECGKEVSSDAKTCPNCGKPQGPKHYSLGSLIILLVGGWFLYSIATSGGSQQSPTRPQGAPARSSEPESPPLELLSWKCEKEHGYVFVLGEVRNVSSRSLENITAVGTFRTKNGDLVKTETALVEYNPILPGQASPFKAGGTDNPQITSCAVAFKHLLGGSVSFTDKSKSKQ